MTNTSTKTPKTKRKRKVIATGSPRTWSTAQKTPRVIKPVIAKKRKKTNG